MTNGSEIIKNETMTSLEIAEVTGRNHKDVMRSIREMEDAWVKVNGRKFALVEYKDAKGEMRPCYSLSKTECLYIATKFNDEARAKMVLPALLCTLSGLRKEDSFCMRSLRSITYCQ